MKFSAKLIGIYSVLLLSVVVLFLNGQRTAVTAAALLAAVLAARAITGQIKALGAAAREIGRGNPDVRVPVGSRDELGTLAVAFSDMAAGLKDAEQRYRAVTDAANDAIICIQAPDRIYLWNKKAEAMFGYPRGEAIGRSLHDFLVPDRYRERASEGLRAFFQTGTGPYIGKTVEVTMLNSHGEEIPVELSLSSMEIKGEWHATAIVRDLTERKRAEEELRRNYEVRTVITRILELSLKDLPLENILQKALDELLGISWLVLRKSGAVFLAEAGGRELVLKAHNNLGEEILRACGRVPFGRCLCGLAASTAETQFADCIDERHAVRHEGMLFHGHYCLPIKIGERILGVVNLYVNEGHCRNQQEEAILEAIVSSLAGVIARKEAETAIRRLNESLEEKVEERSRQLVEAQEALVRKEKLAMLGQLAGTVGHELRNPLGIINNAMFYLKTVLSDSGAAVNDYLDIIRDEVDRSNRIIADLLDFSRVRKPEVLAVPVAVLVHDSVSRCFVPGEVSVRMDLPGKLPEVVADPFQMTQVLQNLVSNAVQAMPEGGILTIRAEEDRDAGTVKIAVADSGAGISPEHMKKLFQPLFTTKARGVGLGLVVSQALAESNGGRLEASSPPGAGATFTLTVPAAR